MKPVHFKYQDLLLKSTFKSFFFSSVLSVIILFLTIAATIQIKHVLETQARHEFSLVCNEIRTKINARLNTQSLLLQSCASFVSAYDTLTQDDWRYFIENSMMFQNMFGYQGLAYNVILSQSDSTAKPGTAGYSVERNTHTSILYIEPYSKDNKRAIGYDTYSEPVRRQAMEYARDLNVSALTEKLTLVQEGQLNKQTGIIMYHPVYKRDMPVNNVAERRSAIMGWVSCPYRMEGLMRNILGPWGLDNTSNHKIHLVIYDHDSVSSSSILYDSRKDETNIRDEISVQMLINPILFNEKNWTLRFSQSKEQYSYFKGKVLAVLICGCIVTLLSFYLSMSLFSSRFGKLPANKALFN